MIINCTNMIPKHYHFSGVCGTAMASLAVLLKNRGHTVTGSDENAYPPMSDFLADNGIPIRTPYHRNNLVPHPDFVVLGNVLSRGNVEVEYALEAHLHYLSMAELIKNELIRGNRSIVISGTHGKTTTTSLVAHVLEADNRSAGFLIGGIAENFGTSSKDVKKGGYFVVEGDEYDTSLFDKRSKFFHYLPDIVIINNIEFDHADIFQNVDEIKRSFSLMLRQVPQNGLIIVNGDDLNAVEVAKTGFSPVVTFGRGVGCDAVLTNIRPREGNLGMAWTLDYQNQKIRLEIPLLGEFNVFNASAVTLLALHEGITVDSITNALRRFKSVKRRLQQVSESNAIRVFDDFAHHPTAIKATIRAIRQSWPHAPVHAIYEARSNTSVRNIYQDEMADAFQDANQVTFYKLHRGDALKTEEKLDLDRVVSELTDRNKKACVMNSLDLIVKHTVQSVCPGDIVLVMSQGSFGGIQHKIAEILDRHEFC